MKNLTINFFNFTPQSIIINYDNNETTHQEEYPLSLFEKFIKENEYLNLETTENHQVKSQGKFSMDEYLKHGVKDSHLIEFLNSRILLSTKI